MAGWQVDRLAGWQEVGKLLKYIGIIITYPSTCCREAVLTQVNESWLPTSLLAHILLQFLLRTYRTAGDLSYLQVYGRINFHLGR